MTSVLRWVFGHPVADTLRSIIQEPLIERALRQHGGGRIVDLGTGEGIYLHLLSGYGQVVALDKTLGRESVALGLPFVYGDLKSLPFVDCSFDVVLCCEVLEHVEDDTRCLGEIARVLASSGWLIISVPVPPAPFPDPDHVRSGYTPERICVMLKAAGFRVRNVTPCMGIGFRLAFRLWRLGRARIWVPRFIPSALCWFERLAVLPVWRPCDVVIVVEKE